MVIKTRTNVYSTCYHLVFVTKYRKDVFTNEEKRKYVKELFNEIAERHEYSLLEIEVVEDHVHLVVNFNPKNSISNVVRILKGAFARTWFKKYPKTKDKLWGGHLWANSYYVGTVGNVSKETVIEYVKKQLTEYNNGHSRHPMIEITGFLTSVLYKNNKEEILKKSKLIITEKIKADGIGLEEETIEGSYSYSNNRGTFLLEIKRLFNQNTRSIINIVSISIYNNKKTEINRYITTVNSFNPGSMFLLKAQNIDHIAIMVSIFDNLNLFKDQDEVNKLISKFTIDNALMEGKIDAEEAPVEYLKLLQNEFNSPV